MEDKKIIALLWQRAESAIDALAQKFGSRLMRTAVNILSDPQDAEEAVSDTYLAVWNAIPPARPDPLCAFVYKTGKNQALKLLRQKTAHRRNSNYDVSLEELSDILTGETLEEQMDARLLGQTIDRFLDTLSKDDRVLFLRRYWFGDSVSDLAQSRHSTPGSISVRLHRLRSRLKDYLYKEGFFL